LGKERGKRNGRERGRGRKRGERRRMVSGVGKNSPEMQRI